MSHPLQCELMLCHQDDEGWAVYSRGHHSAQDFLPAAAAVCAQWRVWPAGPAPAVHTYWRWIPDAEGGFKVLPLSRGRGAVPVTCIYLHGAHLLADGLAVEVGVWEPTGEGGERA